MGRHYTASQPAVVIPAPRVSPERTPVVPEPRGWRARRTARAEAAAAAAQAVQVAHAQRRARQVALATMLDA
jgi:hypothetical protein